MNISFLMSNNSISPKHIAIILDGNRRFAKRLMLQPWKGHEHGKEKVEKLLDYAKNYNVNELTFYALSSENIKSRPKNELNYLFDLFRKTFSGMDKEKLIREGIKINFIGDLTLLPRDLQETCNNLTNQTKTHNQFIVNFAIAYGGRQELVHTIRNIISKQPSQSEINEELIQNNLWLKTNPCLIIRTGGEKRTSNFLPWQSTYSEWIFLNKMWPEFNQEDFINCIEEFKRRKRNYGK
ncbi:di-trans,poly-cis-decaprenylcistransferase [archaeon]|jgi:undecaprenyl diphosphate synthase|nr:di-trans,poly-cis-decaprenylcistransferase [archaeon]MBT4241894.1 di-trans,poly-cis-decaprenylcistransferase [archaeon]MBT4418441.1 di-trans,poly-cis-decaprenylcistransferase [archaeon]